MDPSFITQENGGEIPGARSGHSLASCFGWGCPLPLENKILKADKGIQAEKQTEETDKRGMPTTFIKLAQRSRGTERTVILPSPFSHRTGRKILEALASGD